MMRRCAVAALLAVAAGVPLLRGQTATFKSSVEAVRIDVLVTDRGRPLLSLRPGDFDVRDNGVLQQVEYASFEQIPLNVVLALDTSESVAGERLDHLLAASGELLDGLRDEDQAALITFGHAVVVRSGLTKERESIRRALKYTYAEGQTSLVDAAYAGLATGESDVGRALLLVFSDGLDSTSFLQPEAVVDVAKRSDVVAYGVAVKSLAKPEFLQHLADASGGDLLEVDSTRDLKAAFLKVLDEFRHRYLLSYTPRGVRPAGWHQVEVKVKRRGATVKARPGYLGSGDALLP